MHTPLAAVTRLFALTAMRSRLLIACNEEKAVNKYFNDYGLNRLAAVRDDIGPGGVILAAHGKALYADNMLDYVSTSQSQGDYALNSENRLAEFNAVLKQFDQDRSMDATLALGFITKILPVSFDGSLKLSGSVTVSLGNAIVTRMKVPVVQAFLRSKDSLSFREAMTEFKSQDPPHNSVFLIYEAWRTNRIIISTTDGSDIGADLKVDEIKPVGKGEGKFAYKKTAKSSIDILGDRFYAFAVRTAALKRTPAPNVFALEVTDFTIPGNIVKEVGDEKYSKLVGSPTLQESLNLVSDVEQLNKLHSRAIRP
jgi:hypothetical protein